MRRLHPSGPALGRRGEAGPGRRAGPESEGVHVLPQARAWRARGAPKSDPAATGLGVKRAAPVERVLRPRSLGVGPGPERSPDAASGTAGGGAGPGVAVRALLEVPRRHRLHGRPYAAAEPVPAAVDEARRAGGAPWAAAGKRRGSGRLRGRVRVRAVRAVRPASPPRPRRFRRMSRPSPGPLPPATLCLIRAGNPPRGSPPPRRPPPPRFRPPPSLLFAPHAPRPGSGRRGGLRRVRKHRESRRDGVAAEGSAMKSGDRGGKDPERSAGEGAGDGPRRERAAGAPKEGPETSLQSNVPEETTGGRGTVTKGGLRDSPVDASFP